MKGDRDSDIISFPGICMIQQKKKKEKKSDVFVKNKNKIK